MGALFHLQAKEESLSSMHTSDATTRRPSDVVIFPPRQHDVVVAPPKPKKKKGHSTDPFLRDSTLVAEAARRAQLALMTRDLEDVDIHP